MFATMPKTCCAMSCFSGYKGTTKEGNSLVFLLTPSSVTGGSEQYCEKKLCGFTFEPKNVRVCEMHYHASDVV